MSDESNLENANVVDVLNYLARSTNSVAHAITPPSVGTDAAGGYVGSLTEAVMGVTKGLCEIAAAIESLAAAVQETNRGTQ
jgi:hypothetical protein